MTHDLTSNQNLNGASGVLVQVTSGDKTLNPLDPKSNQGLGNTKNTVSVMPEQLDTKMAQEIQTTLMQADQVLGKMPELKPMATGMAMMPKDAVSAMPTAGPATQLDPKNQQDAKQLLEQVEQKGKMPVPVQTMAQSPVVNDLAVALKGAPPQVIQGVANQFKTDLTRDVAALTGLATNNEGKVANPDLVKFIQADAVAKVTSLNAVNQLLTPAPGATMATLADSMVDLQGLADAVSGNQQATIQHFAQDLRTNLGLNNTRMTQSQPLNMEDIRDDLAQLKLVLNAQGGIPKKVIEHQANDFLEGLGIAMQNPMKPEMKLETKVTGAKM